MSLFLFTRLTSLLGLYRRKCPRCGCLGLISLSVYFVPLYPTVLSVVARAIFKILHSINSYPVILSDLRHKVAFCAVSNSSNYCGLLSSYCERDMPIIEVIAFANKDSGASTKRACTACHFSWCVRLDSRLSLT